MATFQEQYMLNYFDSLWILQKEQDKLKRAAVSARLSDAKRAAAAAAYLDITSQIAVFTDVHEALMRKLTSPGVQAPGKALVDKTEQLEKQLGEEIAQQKEYSAILASVTAFVTAWASLAPQATSPAPATLSGAGGRDATTEAPAATTNLAFIGQA